MVVAFLTVVGLCLGSFVNALVYRLYEQAAREEKRAGKQAASRISKKGKAERDTDDDLSIMRGRSMCPHCQHQLSAADLVPVLSWLSLGGKCRYCKHPISMQYPVVEAATAILFVISYVLWPVALYAQEVVNLAVWLVLLTGLVALLVYDLKWMLLPNRIIAPLSVVAGVLLLLNTVVFDGGWGLLGQAVLAVVVGGGLFWVLFQISDGKWIGGGDVKLGALIGLIIPDPVQVLMVLFLASVLGTIVSVPLLLTKRANRSTLIPFGPFLILATIVAHLFGPALVDWYSQTFLLY